MDTLKYLVTVILPGIVGVAGSGGIIAYFTWKTVKFRALSEMPKQNAEVRHIDADVTVTYADGWQKFAMTMSSRVEALETYVTRLQKDIREQDEANTVLLRQKNKEISDLQDKNFKLEQRVKYLEAEVLRLELDAAPKSEVK